MPKKTVGILVFSQKPKQGEPNEHNQKLINEIEKNNLKAEFFYYGSFSIFLKKDNLQILYNNKVIDHKKILFFLSLYSVSLDNKNVGDKWFIVKCLNQLGIKVFNSFESAMIVKNKRDSYLKLSQAGLPIIPTSINLSEFNLDSILKRNKDNKIIVKASGGLQGYGVTILDSHISFISFMEFLMGKYEPSNLLVQPFINFNNEDYRVFVVGDKAVAGMKRKALGIEFRSNLGKGGVAEKIKVNKKMSELAIAATQTLGLDYAGVDLGKDQKTGKYHIIEVNGLYPGFKVGEVSGVNVAGEIIKHCIKKAKAK